jgi:hypothetical protein
MKCFSDLLLTVCGWTGSPVPTGAHFLRGIRNTKGPLSGNFERKASRWYFGTECSYLNVQIEFPSAVTSWSVVIEYRRFRGLCCLHLQVVTTYSVVIGYRRFRGLCCLHLQVVTPCSGVDGNQRFRGPCCVHLQCGSNGSKEENPDADQCNFWTLKRALNPNPLCSITTNFDIAWHLDSSSNE